MLRRSLMRWMNLAMILVLRSISSAVKQRFPTLDHVVEAGFMTVNEKKLFESVPANEFNTYWVPCTWFIFRLQEATKQGRLLNQYALESIMRVRGICFFLQLIFSVTWWNMYLQLQKVCQLVSNCWCWSVTKMWTVTRAFSFSLPGQSVNRRLL